MNPPKHLLVLTYWRYEDALVQTYTLPYLRIIRDLLPAGSSITLVTLEKQDSAVATHGEIEKGISRLSFQLHPFGWRAIIGWRKNLRILRHFIKSNGITAIHTWCTPAGAIGYLLSKRTGVPLILDSFEPHAEPMVETGTWKKGGMAFRILFRLEKKQVQHAAWKIGVVSGMHAYAQRKYGVVPEPFLVKPACIDLELFQPGNKRNEVRAQLGYTDHIVCIYAGKFGGLYLGHEVFRFFRAAADHWRDKFRVLLLTSTPRKEIDAYCREAGLDPAVVKSVFVPHNRVPEYMSAAEFAISPFKPVPSRKFCTPIKNGEYWAMGLPVVIPEGISDDSDIIRSNHAGHVFRSLDAAGYAEAVKAIGKLLLTENREDRVKRIRALAEKHRNFALAKTVYSKIYG